MRVLRADPGGRWGRGGHGRARPYTRRRARTRRSAEPSRPWTLRGTPVGGALALLASRRARCLDRRDRPRAVPRPDQAQPHGCAGRGQRHRSSAAPGAAGPGPSPRGAGRRRAARAAGRFGVEIAYKQPYDPAMREVGKDWPSRAESMIGLRADGEHPALRRDGDRRRRARRPDRDRRLARRRLHLHAARSSRRTATPTAPCGWPTRSRASRGRTRRGTRPTPATRTSTGRPRRRRDRWSSTTSSATACSTTGSVPRRLVQGHPARPPRSSGSRWCGSTATCTSPRWQAIEALYPKLSPGGFLHRRRLRQPRPRRPAGRSTTTASSTGSPTRSCDDRRLRRLLAQVLSRRPGTPRGTQEVASGKRHPSKGGTSGFSPRSLARP